MSAKRRPSFSLEGGQYPSGPRQTIFVVFGGQRSGSTLVASRLNSHPRIVCHEEVLLPGVEPGPSLTDWMAAQGFPPWLRSLPSIRRSFLDSLVQRETATDIDAIGMKIMYDQLSLWPALGYLAPSLGKVSRDFTLQRWMKSNDTLIIHTVRRNHLRMIISHKLAAQTGQFHLRNGSGLASDDKITLPVRGIIPRLRRTESAERAARGAICDLRVIEVCYEDYIRGNGGEIEREVCEAMGLELPEGGLSSPLAKVTGENMRDVVSNYDEIVQHLTGTRFERFLD